MEDEEDDDDDRDEEADDDDEEDDGSLALASVAAIDRPSCSFSNDGVSMTVAAAVMGSAAYDPRRRDATARRVDVPDIMVDANDQLDELRVRSGLVVSLVQ